MATAPPLFDLDTTHAVAPTRTGYGAIGSMPLPTPNPNGLGARFTPPATQRGFTGLTSFLKLNNMASGGKPLTRIVIKTQMQNQ